MRMEMTKDLKKKAGNYGSVLKAYRAQGGGGAGIMAGGIVLLVFGVLLGALALLGSLRAGAVVFAVFGGPGLLLTLLGNAKRKKRIESYLDFYLKDSGLNREELQEADRELMGPDAVKIGCATDRSGGKKEIVFMITEHYFLSAWPVCGAYLRKIEDIVAAFYSAQIPGIDGYRQNLFVITRRDIGEAGIKNEYTKKQYRGFENSILTKQKHCREVCMEVLGELASRAPRLITCQNIVVDGVKYDLLSMNDWKKDWEKIFRATDGN